SAAAPGAWITQLGVFVKRSTPKNAWASAVTSKTSVVPCTVPRFGVGAGLWRSQGLSQVPSRRCIFHLSARAQVSVAGAGSVSLAQLQVAPASVHPLRIAIASMGPDGVAAGSVSTSDADAMLWLGPRKLAIAVRSKLTSAYSPAQTSRVALASNAAWTSLALTVVSAAAANEVFAGQTLVVSIAATMPFSVQLAGWVTQVTAKRLSCVPGANTVGCLRSATPGVNWLLAPTGMVTAVVFGLR